MMLLSPYRRIGKGIHENPWKVLFATACLTILAGLYTTRITIHADLKELLPPTSKSIQRLNELERQYGSPGYLMLGLEVSEPSDAIAFLHDLVPEVEKIPTVRFVSYRRPISFFTKKLPLFLEEKDLQEIERRLEIKWEAMKKGANPFFDHFLNFTDDDLNFDDLVAKYENMEGLDSASTEYYQNDEGTFFAVLMKPSFSHKNLEESRKLVTAVEEIVQKLEPLKYGRGVRVSYGGEYKTTLDEEEHFKREIANVSGGVLFLLMLVLVLYYRRLSAVPLIGIPLLAGIVWTGGLTYLFLGHVNLVTGFSAMILAGLGSDYGIYLLTRFLQERERGQPLKQAYFNTFMLTSKATRGSALTTVLAFFVLALSGLKGFSELGIIGMLGILMNLLSMHLLLPSLIVLFDTKGILAWERRFFPWSPRLAMKTKWLRYSLPLVAFFLAAGITSATNVSKALTLEYDLSKLENRSLASQQVDQRVSDLFKNSLRPAIITVTGGEEEEREILLAIDRLKEASPSLPMIKGGVALSSFVPPHQSEKKAVIVRIQRLLKKMRLTLYGEAQRFVQYFLAFQPEGEITREQLPKELTELFKLSNSTTSFVFVFPSDLQQTEVHLRAFVDQVGQLSLPNGKTVAPMSDQFMIVEILDMIEKEAPLALGFIFFLSMIYLLLESRNVRTALVIPLVIAFATLLFLGGILFCGLRFNLVNVAAVPIIIGTGFDGMIHLYQRYQEHKRNLFETLSLMIPSISVANLTTAIGFGGLIATDNQALQSLGWLVTLGMLIMTITTLIFFPACLTLWHQASRVKN